MIIKFTDCYGVPHDEALFELHYACNNTTTTEQIGTVVSSNIQSAVSIQYKYWHSQADKDAGRQPQFFCDNTGTNVWTVVCQPTDIGSDLAAFCEAQLKIKVLTVDSGATFS